MLLHFGSQLEQRRHAHPVRGLDTHIQQGFFVNADQRQRRALGQEVTEGIHGHIAAEIQQKTRMNPPGFQVLGHAAGPFAAAEAIHAQGEDQIAAGAVPIPEQLLQRFQQRYHMGTAQGHMQRHILRLPALLPMLAIGHIQSGGEHQRIRHAGTR